MRIPRRRPMLVSGARLSEYGQSVWARPNPGLVTRLLRGPKIEGNGRSAIVPSGNESHLGVIGPRLLVQGVDLECGFFWLSLGVFVPASCGQSTSSIGRSRSPAGGSIDATRLHAFGM